jgi:diguanylate cyclase (GGDEF)-like protein
MLAHRPTGARCTYDRHARRIGGGANACRHSVRSDRAGLARANDLGASGRRDLPPVCPIPGVVDESPPRQCALGGPLRHADSSMDSSSDDDSGTTDGDSAVVRASAERPRPVDGPALAAARRHAASPPIGTRQRGYPLAANPYDATGDAVALAATRALLKVASRAEAARVLHTAVNDLGGAVLPARLAGAGSIPVDVSLGVGEPQVVMVLDEVDLAAMRLTHHLPLLVEDALSAAARSEHQQRQALRATVDPVTGVASRAAIGPRLGAATAADVVCLCDLDGFSELNRRLGHSAGDELLRRFGQLLIDSVRDCDFVGRYGGDEFVVILARTSVAAAATRMRRLADAWAAETDHQTTVSIALAPIGARGAREATAAAAQTLHQAKTRGGNRLEIAYVVDASTSPGHTRGHIPDASS